MKIITDGIARAELQEMAQHSFGNFVKAVVDIDKKIMVVDGELHADEEKLLLEKGSQQENVWGINLYPDLSGDDWIEFDSMINIRPSMANVSRTVENKDTQKKIREVVHEIVRP